MPAEVIRIDGRDFEGATQRMTAAQDDWILYWLGQAGATDLLLQLGTGHETEVSAKRLLHTITGSGNSHQILAGVLTEREKKWTRDEAKRNAAIFADVTDHEEKVAMRGSLVAFVIGFFKLGEASRKTSPKSSSPSEKDHGTSSEEAATSEPSQQ
jgi:hypothetical protein